MTLHSRADLDQLELKTGQRPDGDDHAQVDPAKEDDLFVGQSFQV